MYKVGGKHSAESGSIIMYYALLETGAPSEFY